MLQLGLKTVPMMGTHNLVIQFNMWILRGQLIILFIESCYSIQHVDTSWATNNLIYPLN